MQQERCLDNTFAQMLDKQRSLAGMQSSSAICIAPDVEILSTHLRRLVVLTRSASGKSVWLSEVWVNDKHRSREHLAAVYVYTYLLYVRSGYCMCQMDYHISLLRLHTSQLTGDDSNHLPSRAPESDVTLLHPSHTSITFSGRAQS